VVDGDGVVVLLCSLHCQIEEESRKPEAYNASSEPKRVEVVNACNDELAEANGQPQRGEGHIGRAATLAALALASRHFD